jgi:hypothetical protein
MKKRQSFSYPTVQAPEEPGDGSMSPVRPGKPRGEVQQQRAATENTKGKGRSSLLTGARQGRQAEELESGNSALESEPASKRAMASPAGSGTSPSALAARWNLHGKTALVTGGTRGLG